MFVDWALGDEELTNSSKAMQEIKLEGILERHERQPTAHAGSQKGQRSYADAHAASGAQLPASLIPHP
jgi:uncharacterized alpha/beta hydrolase family protein